MKTKLRGAATSLLLILFVAAGFRVGFAWNNALHNSRHALSVVPFMFESGDIAVSLAQGRGFSSPFRVPTGPTAWMTPVYPLLLAGVFRIFGVYTYNSYVAATGLNILLATLVCIPLFFVGKRIGGTILGASAAWLWAIFPNAILIPFESMWEACLSALLAATILWATLALADSRRIRDWVAYGFLWGFTLMTNPTLESLLPFLLIWLAYRAYKEKRSWLVIARPLLALAVAVFCCIPWTARNYDVFHAFVPLRSVLGLQLWMGNNADASPIWLGQLHPINDSAEREKYIELGEIRYMRYKRDQALAYMRTHPRREAYLIGNRFVALWAGGTPNPITDFFRVRDAWFRYVLLFNICVALGALAGIVLLAWRRSIYTLPLAVFPVVFPFAYYLTLAAPRYRLPIDPVVILLTAIALVACFHRLRAADSDASPNQSLPVSD
ncbi:MAG TPA: glycosyltransferase family 39 protein [Candidatus Acidoferrales bacterium]|nr:glycosyltransferase family 39 protein [Candidatus Acidoferrales bacterium]